MAIYQEKNINPMEKNQFNPTYLVREKSQIPSENTIFAERADRADRADMADMADMAD